MACFDEYANVVTNDTKARGLCRHAARCYLRGVWNPSSQPQLEPHLKWKLPETPEAMMHMA
jgi:hypothetical protein